MIEQRLEPSDIAAWAGADGERIAALRTIVAERSSGDTVVAEAVEGLRALERLDSDVASAIAPLLGDEAAPEATNRLLEAITGDSQGRRMTSEALAARTGARLSDTRQALQEYKALLVDGQVTETDLQRFLEGHPWILGLDYARVLPRQQVVRGEIDFILERFDGFCDLLELKSPQDLIIAGPDTEPPPSASHYALSGELAQALAQVHVYRAALRHDVVAEEWFGLRNAHEPRVVILIGQSADLSDHRGRTLREINRSLHRVEIVPYDVLADRAAAVLDGVEHQLLAVGDGSVLA